MGLRFIAQRTVCASIVARVVFVEGTMALNTSLEGLRRLKKQEGLLNVCVRCVCVCVRVCVCVCVRMYCVCV